MTCDEEDADGRARVIADEKRFYLTIFRIISEM